MLDQIGAMSVYRPNPVLVRASRTVDAERLDVAIAVCIGLTVKTRKRWNRPSAESFFASRVNAAGVVAVSNDAPQFLT